MTGIRTPLSASPEMIELIAHVNTEMLRREPRIVGFREDATKFYIRFVAALSTPWVQVHIQSTQAGEGGTTAYDPDNYASSTEVDCRSDRLQDVSHTFTASSLYAVFLIPKQLDGSGTKILYDGQSGRPDNAAYIGFDV